MRTMKKQFRHLIIAICLMFLVIGFAAFSSTLKINGMYNIGSMKWDVHFENIQITNGSVNASVAPTISNTNTNYITYTIDFTQPGDFYEFTVDVVNAGTIDAMVDVVSNKAHNATGSTEIELPTYLTSTLTYDDGVAITQNQKLVHGTSEKIKVRVEFKKDIEISDLPSDGNTRILFIFNCNYKQADDESIPVRVDFSTASWDDITTAYENNPESLQQSMENGTTKEVELDLDNDGTAETTAHLRIANLSTPSECSGTDFSQTACGLVLEFADIITTHKMNPYDNSGNSIGDGNNGGWKYSDMRAFLNNGKYLEGKTGEIDYTSTGIYSALPSDLKSKIIKTKVVSGHGSKDSTNFITTDKIYLFSTKEVWGKEGTSNVIRYDSAEAETRQLDYYKAKGVTTVYGTSSPAIKKRIDNGNADFWWLRSASSNVDYYFFIVEDYGGWNYYGSRYTGGVAPAFRLSNK